MCHKKRETKDYFGIDVDGACDHNDMIDDGECSRFVRFVFVY